MADRPIVNPNDVKDWLILLGELIVFIFSLGVVWQKITSKVNGMGGRVKKLEDVTSRHEGSLQTLQNQLGDVARMQQDNANRLGRVEKAVEVADGHISDMKIEMLSGFGKIEGLIAESSASLRERIVRIETVQDIEKKTGRRIDD